MLDLPVVATDYRRSVQQRIIAELRRIEANYKPGCAATAFRQGRYIDIGLLQRIEASQLALLLVAGVDEVSSIYEYVPFNLGPLLLGPKPRSIEQAVRLVALNLDWYLTPPQPLRRWEWLGQALSVAVLIYCTMSLIFFIGGAQYFDTGAILLVLALCLIVWLCNSGDARRHCWIHTLRHYLEQLDGEQPG